MEAKDWGGLSVFGSRALGSAEAITVSDGLGHQLSKKRQNTLFAQKKGQKKGSKKGSKK